MPKKGAKKFSCKRITPWKGKPSLTGRAVKDRPERERSLRKNRRREIMNQSVYNPSSKRAEEFISHQEIQETLAYAWENRRNRRLIEEILKKAKERKGLSHREASVLLDCELEDCNHQIQELAQQLKKDFYGNRIVMFAPLYLSNYCINGCIYCPYHKKNQHIARKKLTQDEVRREVIALQDMGHKRLALEAGEDPVNFFLAIC